MKGNDLTRYMPELPATAADLKPGKALSLVDRMELAMEDDATWEAIKEGETTANGHCPTSTTAMFGRAFAAREVINLAKENGDEVLGNLTPVEADRALTYAKRRKGISLRQRRRIAIANQQKAIADQTVQQTKSEG